jgi:hypothetical protein
MTALACAALIAAVPASDPVPVEIVQTGNGYALMRDGEPYFVKGAGAFDRLEELKAAGANSIRTWGSGPDTDPLLNKAHALGLTVTVGIWLAKKEHGFDYNDPAQVQAQFEAAKRDVLRLRNHPALLMWAVGNEMELGNETPEMWKAVEHIAAMIRREDPDHPVMSVLADMWPSKMEGLLKYCPSLHALGINSYGGLPTLHERMRDWRRPYFITEYSHPTPGQFGKTPWDAAIEPSSAQKGELALANYRRSILGFPGRVLGSYFFHWSRSDFATSGWYSAFLKSGEKTSTVDAMTKAWSGEWPKNRAPEIVFMSPSQVETKPGESVRVRIRTRDADQDSLSLTYEVSSDDPSKRFVGDHEQSMPVISSGPASGSFAVRAPSEPGTYRILVVARDGKGGGATASASLHVR